MRIDVLNTELNTGASYWIEGDELTDNEISTIKDVLRDPIDQVILYEEARPNFHQLLEVSFRPGVTDNAAIALKTVLSDLIPNKKIELATGRIFLFNQGEKVDIDQLHNPLIERANLFQFHQASDYVPSPLFPKVELPLREINYFDFDVLTVKELEELSLKNVWAFSTSELQHLKEYFTSQEVKDDRNKKGLSSKISDIEVEILAQTWSEHCKHKIFGAEINYTESEQMTGKKLGNFTVTSVFKTHIRDITNTIKKDWLISVFEDNAGIVRFGQNNDYCLKVETHNSPSALDPYGGALTGILGVNRDILGCGIGAEPIANMNALCFGSQKYPSDIVDQLPKKLKSPQTILNGVHKGIEDGGNKSGIPTINGAMSFHDNFAGKPLVYCGTVGIIPQKINGHDSYLKRHIPGDIIVICGGSVGADGIHGATFSSMELDDNSPATAVQIGDPLTQRRLTDFLLEARDAGLYRGITDNGAGGLSSSIGEMAQKTNGAVINLEAIPLKYPGLSPFEIIISESQERMSFAVAPEKLKEFLCLANKRAVNPAVIGHFHDEGSFDIKLNSKLIASLSLDFMHNSLPPMKLKAHYLGENIECTWYKKSANPKKESFESLVEKVLSNENIASKYHLVEQFDHEVKAATIHKPFTTKEKISPNDCGVIWGAPFGEHKDLGVSLACALLPHLSHVDTYFMTQMVIDEAIRNLIVAGTDPDYIALCDNYCWPDPIESENNPDGAHKLAQLVRSTKALADTALAYQTPFISGKDSMKNDFVGFRGDSEKIKISVPPTLLITGIGKVNNVNKLRSSAFQNSGDIIVYIGPMDFKKKYKSHAFETSYDLPRFDSEMNWEIHQAVYHLLEHELIESIHDVSEGGIFTSLVESSFANNLSFCLRDFLDSNEDLHAFCFNELPAGYTATIKPENFERFRTEFKLPYRKLGLVTSNEEIIINEYQLNKNHMYKIWSQND